MTSIEEKIAKYLAVIDAQLNMLDEDRRKIERYRQYNDANGARRMRTNLERVLRELTCNMRDHQIALLERRIESTVSKVSEHEQSVCSSSVPYNQCNESQSTSDVVEKELRSMQKLQRHDLEELRIEADRRQAEALAHQKITRDIADLNEVMRDLQFIVQESGEKVDSIEANIERSQLHVSTGLRNVKKAAKYQSAVKYPLVGGAVGAAVAGGPVGAAAGIWAGVAAAAGGAIAGLLSGSWAKREVIREADRPMITHQEDES